MSREDFLQLQAWAGEGVPADAIVNAMEAYFTRREKRAKAAAFVALSHLAKDVAKAAQAALGPGPGRRAPGGSRRLGRGQGAAALGPAGPGPVRRLEAAPGRGPGPGRPRLPGPLRCGAQGFPGRWWPRPSSAWAAAAGPCGSSWRPAWPSPAWRRAPWSGAGPGTTTGAGWCAKPGAFPCKIGGPEGRLHGSRTRGRRLARRTGTPHPGLLPGFAAVAAGPEGPGRRPGKRCCGSPRRWTGRPTCPTSPTASWACRRCSGCGPCWRKAASCGSWPPSSTLSPTTSRSPAARSLGAIGRGSGSWDNLRLALAQHRPAIAWGEAGAVAAVRREQFRLLESAAEAGHGQRGAQAGGGAAPGRPVPGPGRAPGRRPDAAGPGGVAMRRGALRPFWHDRARRRLGERRSGARRGPRSRSPGRTGPRPGRSATRAWWTCWTGSRPGSRPGAAAATCWRRWPWPRPRSSWTPAGTWRARPPGISSYLAALAQRAPRKPAAAPPPPGCRRRPW